MSLAGALGAAALARRDMSIAEAERIIFDPLVSIARAREAAAVRARLLGPLPSPRPRCAGDLELNPTGASMCECSHSEGGHARNPYGPCHHAACTCRKFKPKAPAAAATGRPATGGEPRRHRNHARRQKDAWRF